MRADKAKVLRLLKTASGQIDGVIKMIDEDRYCLDISSQIMAAQSVLKRANREIISAHVSGCVREASSDVEREEKIDEILMLLEKLM
ncbi:MAG: metal-sensing transcriptional repressor [Clostridia bacterium]|nr:metal-sensing transcriptional repressor [Clostridia bacterium]MBQ5814011.1 metal-sensing transcriptional repressor [Clostridia bacterium]